MFYLDVIKAFNKAKIPYAIVGGLAVSLHGAVRGTVDIDFITLIDKGNFKNIEKTLLKLGLKPMLPVTAENVFDYRIEYIKNRNLIAWSFCDPKNPSRIVDIIITHDLKKLNSTEIKIGSVKASVLSKKDLINMKTESGRIQDLEDVKALEKLQ